MENNDLTSKLKPLPKIADCVKPLPKIADCIKQPDGNTITDNIKPLDLGNVMETITKTASEAAESIFTSPTEPDTERPYVLDEEYDLPEIPDIVVVDGPPDDSPDMPDIANDL